MGQLRGSGGWGLSLQQAGGSGRAGAHVRADGRAGGRAGTVCLREARASRREEVWHLLVRLPGRPLLISFAGLQSKLGAGAAVSERATGV